MHTQMENTDLFWQSIIVQNIYECKLGKVIPSSKLHPAKKTLLRCEEGENTAHSKLTALRLRREASSFLRSGFLIMSPIQSTHVPHIHEFLPTVTTLYFAIQSRAGRTVWLGSCRDETQLNKQIKWCLDGRTWTCFQGFFFKIHSNVWLNPAHYPLSNILLYIQLFIV